MTDRRPLFSIIVPTRSRPHYLYDALMSVLMQNFKDFEVIVSDNCNDPRTKFVVEMMGEHTNLRYVRPPTFLTMHDHWEFASLHARGEYIFILQDRSFLRQGALRQIAEIIQKAPKLPLLVSTRVGRFDEVELKMAWDPGTTGRSAYIPTHELLNDFLSFKLALHEHLPRSNNGFFHRSIVDQVRAKSGQFYQAVNPDYTPFLQCFALCDEVFHVDVTAVMNQGVSQSNGCTNSFDAEKCYAYYDSIKMDVLEEFKDLPLTLATATNGLARDFLVCRKAMGGKLENFSINWLGYFQRTYYDLRKYEVNGLTNPDLLPYLWNAFNGAVTRYRDELQLDLSRLKDMELQGWELEEAKVYRIGKNGALPGSKAKNHYLTLYVGGDFSPADLCEQLFHLEVEDGEKRDRSTSVL